MLRAELDARGMSAHRLALAIRVPANRITAILRGDRAVTAETAVRRMSASRYRRATESRRDTYRETGTGPADIRDSG